MNNGSQDERSKAARGAAPDDGSVSAGPSNEDRPKDAPGGWEASSVDSAFEDAASAECDARRARLEADLHAARDEALRAQAELENFRKRIRREMDDDRKYAAFPLLRDLLPVVDNLARASAAAQSSQSAETSALAMGVRMVADELRTVMERHQCKRIESLGQPFDASVHAAIGQIPSSGRQPGTIVQVAVEGYQLFDRVVRPAQVMIACEPPAKTT
ncbi:MAG: nucleotide exchange factor GrpE [Planctomycetes bacterium]|nr:nucleotide exchange factor GrpE [Planctomycetota bacterium]